MILDLRKALTMEDIARAYWSYQTRKLEREGRRIYESENKL